MCVCVCVCFFVVAVLLALRSGERQISRRCKPIHILSLTSRSFASDSIFFFYACQWIKQLNDPLETIDPEIADIIELEKARQWKVNPSFIVVECFALKFGLINSVSDFMHNCCLWKFILYGMRRGSNLYLRRISRRCRWCKPLDRWWRINTAKDIPVLDTMEEMSMWICFWTFCFEFRNLEIYCRIWIAVCWFWDCVYYSGFRYIDMAETLCQKRALEAFRLDPAKWGG